jgi:hypothetical protein
MVRAMSTPATSEDALTLAVGCTFELEAEGLHQRRWHTFDARNTIPRTGRVVVGRGRDAVDVALITSFGPLTLTGFEVRAQELAAASRD